MGVRNVDLDHRALERCEGIVYRPRIMSQSTGVDDDDVVAPARGMNGIDQITLVVGLKIFDDPTASLGEHANDLYVVGQGVGAVDRGFSLTEKVQIRPVKKQDAGHDSTIPPPDRNVFAVYLTRRDTR